MKNRLHALAAGGALVVFPLLAGSALGTPADRADPPAHSDAMLGISAGAGGACLAGPEVVPMRPTQNAPGGRADMILSQPQGPFGIIVDHEGRQLYEVDVRVSQLRRFDERHYVVWAATPELDQHQKLGLLDATGRIQGRIYWNKFLVFVTEEPDPSIERWEGPVLLRGISPSARMHTMAGHGPFEGMNCQQIF